MSILRAFVYKRLREFVSKRLREFVYERLIEFVSKRLREFVYERLRAFVYKRLLVEWISLSTTGRKTGRMGRDGVLLNSIERMLVRF